MKDAMNLNQIIFDFLAAQIEFGAYRIGDDLPSIEETSLWFSVSVDTVRYAYLRLKQENYITLAKKARATVTVQFDTQQIDRHIQTFFSLRRDAVIDLCHALGPMFSRAQWFSMKNASTKQLDLLEHLCTKRNIRPAHKMIRQVQLIYSTLNNDLLLRLVWQAFMFFQGPFLSLPQNISISELGDPSLLLMIDLCRRKDWNRLLQVIDDFQIQLFSAICKFYKEHISMDPPGKPIDFYWNAYEKSSQQRYTLAMEILKDIRQGAYQEEDFLPSPARLAETRQVSIITIRRTLSLLNQLGATESVNGVGTRILKTDESTKNCDFSRPDLQKRLLDFAQSLEILSLTCRGVAENSLAAMKESDIQKCKERLLTLKQISRHESVVITSLEMISQFSPIRSVREIYAELLQILLWGYPLRSMHGSKSVVNAFYLPHIDSLIACLEHHDFAELADRIEALLFYEFEFAVTHLKESGVRQVSRLMHPINER